MLKYAIISMLIINVIPIVIGLLASRTLSRWEKEDKKNKNKIKNHEQ